MRKTSRQSRGQNRTAPARLSAGFRDLKSALWLVPLTLALSGLAQPAYAAQRIYTPNGGHVQMPAPRAPVAATALQPVATGQKISGLAQVLSPNMLNVNGYDIRLHGIIVPLEMASQSKASSQLIRLTKGEPVECYTVGTDTDGIPLAACGTGTFPNLALALLDAGRAMVDRQQVAGTPVAELYLNAERQARRGDLGLWGNETGPIPTYPAGYARQAAPVDLSPPAPKPYASMADNGAGPVIRFDDGSVVDLSRPVRLPAESMRALGPDEARDMSDASAAMMLPDVPLSGIDPEALDKVSFNTLGLSALPTGTQTAKPVQVAGRDSTMSAGELDPRLEPEVSLSNPATDRMIGFSNTLVSLIAHMDEAISRQRLARDQGKVYLPTPPGEAPRFADDPAASAGAGDVWRWLLLALMVVMSAGGIAYIWRWYNGVWPWEAESEPEEQGWTTRRKQGLNVARTLDQDALNLSFALSERADIARLAGSTPSGRTASDLRALRLDPPAFVADNWERIGHFSRPLGLRARQLYSEISEYDRRVADLAALATEGRLHESGATVFGELAKRLEALSVQARDLHRDVRERINMTASPAPARKPVRKQMPVTGVRLAPRVTGTVANGWAAAAARG